MVLEIGQWSAEETIFFQKQCPQYFGSRTTNMIEAHVAPITSTHNWQTGRPTLHAVEINAR